MHCVRKSIFDSLLSYVTFKKVIRKCFVFSVYNSKVLLESLELLEIKWQVLFKIDGIGLCLGCHAVTFCGSLFSQVLSCSNSCLSIFAIYFTVLFHSFSWNARSISIDFKNMILLLNRYSDSSEQIHLNRINCSLGILFGTYGG